MKYAFFFLCFSALTSSFAQNTEQKRFKFGYISLESNSFGVRKSQLNSTLTSDMVNNNSQVATNMMNMDSLLSNGFDNYGYAYGFGYGYGLFGMSMGKSRSSYSSLSVQLIDQKMKRFEGRLTFGIGTGNVEVGTRYKYMEATGRYDTLISQKTGDMTFIDTTFRRNFYLGAYTQLTGVQVGYELHTKNSRRFHFYTGALLNVNFSSRINVTAHEFVQNGVQSDTYSSGDYRYENVELKNGFVMSQLTIPVGVEMKLGLRDNFLGNLSLRANLRGVANLTSSTYTGDNFYTSFGGGMGILFRFP